MNQKCLIIIIGLLLYSNFSNLISSVPIISHDGILYVGGIGPGNYTNIQDAIDNATYGDTIYVFYHHSPYQETLFIEKTITLKGENKTRTVIDGGNKGDTITIEQNNVTLTDLTICNGSKGPSIFNWFYSGIRIRADFVTIKNTIIRNNRLGIFIKNGKHCILQHNILQNNCIVIAPYDRDAISMPYEKDYYFHTIENNTLNDRPILYHYGLTNAKLSKNAGQIILADCHNICLYDMNFIHSDFAIILINSSHNCIVNNTITNGSAGMLWLLYSKNNCIKNNLIKNNLEGICLDQGSSYNVLKHNTLDDNHICNLMIESKSNHNLIYQNNFIGSPRAQTYIKNSFRTKYLQNYWADHLTLLPKMIIGELTLPFIPLLRFPWLSIDWNPAACPFEQQ